MTALAVEPRAALDFALLPFTAEDNPVAMTHIMVALAHVPELARDSWVDFRICGISQETIAVREQVSRSAIGQRVKLCDRAIRAYTARLR